MPTSLYAQEKRRGNENGSPSFWKPFWLRRTVLVIFGATFALLAVALGILEVYTSRNQGISTANPQDHYLWTYGPTAIFTLVSVFWAQTEYRAKQLQPWVLMKKGLQPASHSILLDYISPLNIISLFNATVHGHVLASLGIISTLLLKLAIVLSTGLFVLQHVAITDTSAILRLRENFAFRDHSFFMGDIKTISPDPRPVAVILGVEGKHLTLPNGTTSKQTFLQFEPKPEPINGFDSVQAETEVFDAWLECETATFLLSSNVAVRNSYSPSEWLPANSTSVSSKSCTNATANIAYWGGYDTWTFNYTADGIDGLAFGAGLVKCGNYHPDNTTDRWRYLIYIGSVGVKDGNQSPNITSLLCAPRHVVHSTYVEIDEAGQGVVAQNDISTSSTSSHQIDGLTSKGLAMAFVSSVMEASALIEESTPKYLGENLTVSYLFAEQFQLMDTIEPQASIQEWRNETLLNATLQRTFAFWAAQMASLHLKAPADKTVSGNMTATRPRLTIHSVSFWAVEGVLLALISVTIGLAAVAETDVIPRNPTALGGLTTLFATSDQVRVRLKGVWRYSEDALRSHFSTDQFSTGIGSTDSLDEVCTFSIRTEAFSSNDNSTVKSEDRSGESWWRPWAVSYWYIVGATVLIIALVALLETLYQYSVKNNGLASVDDPDSEIHFAWTLVPALIMVLTASIVGMLHFAVRALWPYQSLKKGSVPARVGLFRYPFSGSGIHALLWQQQPAMISTTLAVFLSSFLTIVVSGLFTPVQVSNAEAVTAQQTDKFAHVARAQNKSPLQIELVTVGNLSYPRFTYDTFVLPTLEASTGTSGTLNMQMPALQGIMNCSVLPPEDIVSVNNTYFWHNVLEDSGMTNDTLFGVIYDRNDCFDGITETWQDYTLSNGKTAFSMTGQNFLRMPPTGYFGYIWEGSNSDDNTNTTCPTMMGVLGETNKHRITEYTIFTCNPYVHQIQVNATFRLPGMDIDVTSPPIAQSGPAQVYEFTYSRVAGDGKFGTMAPTPLAAFQLFDTPLPQAHEKFGSFMQVLVGGSQGIPAAQLVNKSRTEELFSAMDHLWAVGMAQFLNEFRIPLATDSQIPLTGTRTFLGPYRLVQSAVSTRILEGLLGAILVFMLLAFFSMGCTRILKLNPCHIAGMASLLVDSEIFAQKDMIPKGAEWLSDEELMKQGVFDGWVFSLGWWNSAANGEEGEERRYGVDIGKVE